MPFSSVRMHLDVLAQEWIHSRKKLQQSKYLPLLGDPTVSSVPLKANPLPHTNFMTFMILSSRDFRYFFSSSSCFVRAASIFSPPFRRLIRYRSPVWCIELNSCLSMSSWAFFQSLKPSQNACNSVVDEAANLQVKQYKLPLVSL